MAKMPHPNRMPGPGDEATWGRPISGTNDPRNIDPRDYCYSNCDEDTNLCGRDPDECIAEANNDAAVERGLERMEREKDYYDDYGKY